MGDPKRHHARHAKCVNEGAFLPVGIQHQEHDGEKDNSAQ